MPHHIFETKGIIFGSREHGEASRYFEIYTEDLGLVFAHAQGVRKHTSKLRYSLQDFSVCRLNLVRGREIWRLTNARREDAETAFPTGPRLKILASVFALTRGLVRGEEAHQELFDHLKLSLHLLSEENWTDEELRNLEAGIVLGILDRLGYLGGSDLAGRSKTGLSRELVEAISAQRGRVLSEINASLRASGL